MGRACCKWLAIVTVKSCCTAVGDSHKASKLVLRSVQTVLPCTSPQPHRESKLHEFLKGFFLKGAFVKTILLFKVQNMINLASSCSLHCIPGGGL